MNPAPQALIRALIEETGGLYVIARAEGPNVIDLAAERAKRQHQSKSKQIKAGPDDGER